MKLLQKSITRKTETVHIGLLIFLGESQYRKVIDYKPRNISFCNDPTAGSPTVTLLRLLVPLNDQV